MYLIINEMTGHVEYNSIEEKNENKYLVLDEIDENKEVLNKYGEVGEGIKIEIETINCGEKFEYGKDLKNIRFVSNDDLPINKPIKLRLLTITIRSGCNWTRTQNHLVLKRTHSIIWPVRLARSFVRDMTRTYSQSLLDLFLVKNGKFYP